MVNNHFEHISSNSDKPIKEDNKESSCVIEYGKKNFSVFSTLLDGSEQTKLELSNNDVIKRQVWEEIKQRKDFNMFLEYEQKVKQIDFIELNEILSPAEAVSEFLEWYKSA